MAAKKLAKKATKTPPERRAPGSSCGASRERFRERRSLRTLAPRAPRQVRGDLATADEERHRAEPGVSYAEALDVALSFGWIDGQTKTYDAESWLRKFVPRGARSIWSKINRDKALALIAEKRMQPAGLAAGRTRQEGRPLGRGLRLAEQGRAVRGVCGGARGVTARCGVLCHVERRQSLLGVVSRKGTEKAGDADTQDPRAHCHARAGPKDPRLSARRSAHWRQT